MDDSRTARSRSKIQMLLIVNAVLMTVLLTALYYRWNEAGSVPRADESVPVPASLVAVSSNETADRAPSLTVPSEPPNKHPRPKSAAPLAAATEKSVLAPEKRPLPTGPIITARAWVGEPFGIGKLNILFNPDDAPHWRPDQTVFLHETSLRTRHPVIRVVKPDGAKGAAQLTELNVTFLFSGSEPLDLTLTAADAELARIESIHPSNDEAEHRQVLNAWWEKFQEDLSNATGNQYLFRSYWARMLAHRLKLQLEVPYSANKADRGTAEIERRFEHIVSALFGIDSVLLAMPDYEPRLKQVELASQPLPTPMRLRSVAIPTIPHGIDIEDIAFRAPQDCYYVRCQRVKNYLWLRDLLMQWGGSLQEVVAARTIDFDIRRTIERQLAIGAETTFTLGADRAIADLALIGSDLFFRDGTGVGALFEAKDSALLSDIINKQREERLKNDPSLQQILVQIEGHDVSLLLAPGNVVRSYYVVDGDYHLVTNSRDIATKFLQTGRAKSGLGHLREFQYARSKAVPRLQHRVWIYVSDPFFRRIVSPEYRIEVGRRAEALAKLQELRLGSLTAASEDATDTTVDALRDQGFLSTDFAIRADESQAMLVRGVAVDSLRGRPGTFKPIPDMAITRATRREVAEYNNFRHEYARQWRVMDPVVVSIASAPSNQAHRQNVSMRVMVTPYARERYSFLTNSLGPTSSRRINRLPGDLLSLEAGLRGNGQTYQAHVGLHDGRVAFRIEDGEIVRERPFEHTPFGRRNFYAVVQPSGLTGLGLIRRFAESLAASTSRGSSFDELSPEDRSPNVTASDDFLVAGLKWIVESVLLKPIKVMGSSSSIVNTGGWSVVARNHELLDTVPRQLGLGGQDRSSQIRFRMRDVNSAAVAPYVHAYSFLEARKSSAASAALLDLVTQQLNQRPEDARSVAERALRARLMCPLGGDYELAASGWRSSAWATDSYVDVKAAPADYRHPFLNWLRGLDVAFKLSPNTLVADINMEVLASGDRRRESDFIAIDQKESSAPPPHTTLKTVATQNERLRAVTDATRLQAGDTVVVIDTAATLRLGRTTLAALIAGERFRVLETLGEWVGVQREHDRLVQRAWVHQKFLGTVEQADNE